MLPIISLTERHISDLARLHQETLSESFLPSLGLPFLERLYEGLLKSTYFFGLIANDQNKLIGFLLGSLDTTRLMGDVYRKHGLYLILPLLKKFLRRPSTLLQALQTTNYEARKQRKTGFAAELMTLGVHSSYRRRKIATHLCHALEDRLRDRQVKGYHVTVHQDLTEANQFYQNSGFYLRNSFSLHGKIWNLYEKELAYPHSNAD